ncbi:zinc finger, CCHC-type containing protein [Tanacetum coccineum]|uniref:Zinc finger, CCHC-type containing protein n=1 Tax=Tanacetum coccineum TaxID=301880 RepID=A0ABQ5GRI0_9ASTR
MGDDHFAPVHGKGSVVLEFSSGKSITLFNVLYVPKLRIIHETTAPYTPQQNGLAEWKNRALKEMVNAMLSYSGLSVGFWGEAMAIVKLLDPKRKTLGEKGIDCIFVGYAEHFKAYRFYVIEPNDSVSINTIIESRDAIFDENSFSSIPRPNDIILNSNESQKDYHSNDVPSETPESRKVARITTIRLLLALVAIHNLVIHQMDVKITFLNGDLEEKVYMKQPKGFVMPGFIICLYVDDMLIFGTDQNQVDKTKKFLSSKFSMKVMGEADVILGIKIKSENKGIVITQTLYIEKILKKFNREDCSQVFLLGGCAILWASKKQTCITSYTMESEFVALSAAGKEAGWLRILICT